MLARVIRDESDFSAAAPQIQRVLTECLRKDPRKRPRDIGDVWRLLDTSPPATVAAPAAPAGKRSRRGSWMWPVIIAALIVLAGSFPELLHWRQTPRTSLNNFTPSPDGRKL